MCLLSSASQTIVFSSTIHVTMYPSRCVHMRLCKSHLETSSNSKLKLLKAEIWVKKDQNKRA